MVILDVNDSSISLLAVTGKKVDKAISLPLERGMVKDGVIENIIYHQSNYKAVASF